MFSLVHFALFDIINKILDFKWSQPISISPPNMPIYKTKLTIKITLLEVACFLKRNVFFLSVWPYTHHLVSRHRVE